MKSPYIINVVSIERLDRNKQCRYRATRSFPFLESVDCQHM